MTKKIYQLTMSLLLGIGLSNIFLIRLQQDCIYKWKKMSKKNRGMFLLMTQWMNIKQEGKKIEDYFKKNNYKQIAVYGMSHIGMAVVKELENSQIKVIYGIDRNAMNIYSKIKLFTLDENFPDVDAIVVTLVEEFDDISESLLRKISCPIIAIEDIVNEI